MRKNIPPLIAGSIIALALLMTACSYPSLPDLFFGSGTLPATAAATASAGTLDSAPTAAIEAYLMALVAKDRAKYNALVCTEWADQATLEFDSFGAVVPSLKGVKCDKGVVQGDSATVTCKGSI